MDEFELPDIHPDVRDAGSGTRGEQQHVAGTERVHERGDLGTGAGLIAAHARQADTVLTVGVLNQSRAIEPVVRRAAPDVRRPQRLDGGLHHVHGIAADRGGGPWLRKVGGTRGLTQDPFTVPPPLPLLPFLISGLIRPDLLARLPLLKARIPVLTLLPQL